ncbi:MAG TPA: 4,5-DOPA dioxygenase extradiol [Sunxiuqinia sp.]|nr:4,5-DOPA dioxygenase extradiol [Sunxiuqinia sp.]
MGKLNPSDRMPLLFIGHGNPMNAILDNAFHRSWQQLGQQLPKPQAILCVSAHWLSRGTAVTAMEHPKTIHDFGGFPQELFDQQYPAPGEPELAKQIQLMSRDHEILADHEWGLDHGSWSVIKPMFPDADVPVVQLSLDYYAPISYHYELAENLRKLREKGVLIIGSGNLVHNLRQMSMSGKVFDWALEFDQKVADLVTKGDDQEMINFQNWGSLSKMAHPTFDHLLPLFYVLGMKYPDEQPHFFNESIDLGSVSMRSVLFSK